MTKGEKVFNVVVSIAVILTGAGFGALTGFAYSEERYWWVGLIIGAVVAFPLAKLYLWQLNKTFMKACCKKKTWFWGTFVAIICGVICTTAVHAPLAILVYPAGPFNTEIGNLVPITIIVGEIIGAGAGLIVGGVCSLVYVLKIKGNHSESA
ncbi:MAG: hypothetical protein OEV87_12020 [Phycisphaerae bacterium]|nr:hypothetical protein [Phycisphaerae bacterium]